MTLNEQALKVMGAELNQGKDLMTPRPEYRFKGLKHAAMPGLSNLQFA